MVSDRMRTKLAGIVLLVGAAMILMAGPALAQDGARSFTAGSCTSVLNGTISPVYSMYCDLAHLPPPPGCRDNVTVCTPGPPNPVYWAANCPVRQNTTIGGPFYYHFDYSMGEIDQVLGESTDGDYELCVEYYLVAGFFDKDGGFVPKPPQIASGSMCPSNSTISGNATLPSGFTIPEGGRFGVKFWISQPCGGTDGLLTNCFESENLGVNGYPICVDLLMNSSLFVNVTTSNPPYPICRGEAVPTLTQWGMMLMSLAIAVCGAWAVRRKVRRSA